MNLNNFYFNIKSSPWPLMLTINLMNLMMNLIFNLNYKFNTMMILIMILNFNSMMLWLNHNYLINLKMNYFNSYLKMTKKIFLMMFIFSELMFFMSFFYINLSIKYFNNTMFNFGNLKLFNLNFFMAMINSLILINSSLTLMIALNYNLKFKYTNLLFINMTLILGGYFIIIQIFEYMMFKFNISNSILLSNFFMLTSFHMFHVIMGLTMIYLLKLFKYFNLNPMNLEFKMMCIYWHFIDLIWIFIFIMFY